VEMEARAAGLLSTGSTISLYRGDSVPQAILAEEPRLRRVALAEHFLGTGLMAKHALGGSSHHLAGRDLVDLVLAHVGFEPGTSEQDLSEHSPMISFSQDPHTALAFALRGEDLRVEPCGFEEASHFMWVLEAPIEHQIEAGHFALRFRASSVQCRAIVAGQLERGAHAASARGSFGLLLRSLASQTALAYADNDPSEHYAELIHVVPFIQAQRHRAINDRLLTKTLDRAGRNREWLLYPMDPMPDGPGFSSRFPMNDYLKVHGCYRASTVP
jgi:hypothetical protein